MAKRQIVLDTETTGLDPNQGHRIIEIGCVELVGRQLTGREFHTYLNPNREVDAGAVQVHGLDNQFLSDKPVFEAVRESFLAFIKDAELIIHNAPFDLGFLDSELAKVKHKTPLRKSNSVIDTLVMARKKHPGQRNSLDALCKRYAIDNSNRDLHGALLDAKILTSVYLALTSGQDNLFAESGEAESTSVRGETIDAVQTITRGEALRVIYAKESEQDAHEKCLQALSASCKEEIDW